MSALFVLQAVMLVLKNGAMRDLVFFSNHGLSYILLKWTIKSHEIGLFNLLCGHRGFFCIKMDRWSRFWGCHHSTNLCKFGYYCIADLCLIRSANVWKIPKYMLRFFNICATSPVWIANTVSIHFCKYLHIRICICGYLKKKKIRMKVTLRISKTPRTRIYTFDKEATKYQPVINKDE